MCSPILNLPGVQMYSSAIWPLSPYPVLSPGGPMGLLGSANQLFSMCRTEDTCLSLQPAMGVHDMSLPPPKPILSDFTPSLPTIQLPSPQKVSPSSWHWGSPSTGAGLSTGAVSSSLGRKYNAQCRLCDCATGSGHNRIGHLVLTKRCTSSELIINLYCICSHNGDCY